jgi:hypothetical protein
MIVCDQLTACEGELLDISSGILCPPTISPAKVAIKPCAVETSSLRSVVLHQVLVLEVLVLVVQAEVSDMSS